MSIPQSFLDDLTARCDIVELVSQYVQLKKSGANYFGLCPFHNEKTASFSVAPERQIFHCFGCGAGGGAIRFIMQIEGLDFVDAVKFLADRVGMTVPEDGSVSEDGRRARARLLELNRDAARFFHAQLMSDAGREGLNYFRGRQLSQKTVNNFGLGFAPPGWDNLINDMTRRGYSKQELIDAGLVVKNERGGIYDKFRNRVMFPIIDVRGNVIAFGGRVLDDSKPKYLNSPETQIFSKSRNLFALNLARKSKEKRFILAEGYMDVISLHQAGFDTAIASLGTSLTEEQARLISRYTDQVVISYDGDAAGRAATERAIEIFKRTGGMKIKVLSFSGAKDPDEYIKKNGAHAFALLLDNSESHMEYKLDMAAAKYDLKSDAGRVSFIKEAVALLASCQSPVEREIYAARAADSAGVSADAVKNELKRELSRRKKKQLKDEHIKVISPERAAQPAAKTVKYDNVRSALAEEGVIGLASADAQLLEYARDNLSPDDFSSEFLGQVFAKITGEYEQAGQLPSFDRISADMPTDRVNHLAAVMARTELSGGERAMRDFIDIIKFEKMKTGLADSEFSLEAAAQKYREKKGYGGE